MAESSLNQWINPLYLVPETIAQVEKTFHSHKDIKSIQLGQFLLAGKAEKLQKALEKSKWAHAYVPHMYSYSITTNESAFKDFLALLNTNGFKTLIGTMIKKQIKVVRPHALSFVHKDYTLLHDNIDDKEHILCAFDFTKEWPENAGGQMIFTHPESEPMIFPPSFNAMNIVSVSKDVHMFVKYVNNNSAKKKIFVIEVNME